MGYAADEGLPEVVTDTSPQALSTVEAQSRHHQVDERDKYTVFYDDAPKFFNTSPGHLEPPQATDRSPDGSVPWEPLAAGDGSLGSREINSQKAVAEPRICGFRRKPFFLVLAVALIVVAAAVGGGVGGGIAAARARGETTSDMPGSPDSSPSFLNNETGPIGFAFQGFSGVNYTGKATKLFREEGFFDLGIDCLSYVWLPNTTDCCVTFCADQHNAAGYICQARKREQASGPFPRIYIWCDQNVAVTKANNTCS